MFLVFQALCLALLHRHVRAGSGYLLDPPSRSSMWRVPEFSNVAPINYNDMSIDCGSGGAQWTQYNEINQGRCGPCGDEWSLPIPRPNEEDGEFGQGIIGKIYQAEDIAKLTVVLMTSMLGYFEFRLCAYKKSSKELVTQECFDRHLLTMSDGSTRYYIADKQDNTNHTVSLKLPSGNVNCEHCVIQWRYYTGNSWGICDDGSSGLGCGAQAEYRNCADVTILPLKSSGYLQDPPIRSSISSDVTDVSDYMLLDCGGQWAQNNDVNQGQCGECGDEWQLQRPRPNEEGGQYGRGIVGKKYKAEDIVNMTVFLTVDFSGYFEFRLCADKPEAEQLVTQECFDKHLLTLIDGTTRYYIPENYKENSYHNVSVRLPAGDVNCEHCVIQWRYKTGHQSWGTCDNGSFAMGCGKKQQEIRNCADVIITPKPLTETPKGVLFFYNHILKF